MALRPSPLGFILGIALVALWALLWLAFLSQVLDSPEATARRPGPVAELARMSRELPGRAT